MRQVKKVNHWCSGMKVHIGVDADSGLGHTVGAADFNDVTQAHALLLGQGPDFFMDAGYEREGKRQAQSEPSL